MGYAEYYFKDYGAAADAYTRCKQKIMEFGNPTNCNNRIHLHGTKGGYLVIFDHGFGSSNETMIESCFGICKENGTYIEKTDSA